MKEDSCGSLYEVEEVVEEVEEVVEEVEKEVECLQFMTRVICAMASTWRAAKLSTALALYLFLYLFHYLIYLV